MAKGNIGRTENLSGGCPEENGPEVQGLYQGGGCTKFCASRRKRGEQRASIKALIILNVSRKNDLLKYQRICGFRKNSLRSKREWMGK